MCGKNVPKSVFMLAVLCVLCATLALSATAESARGDEKPTAEAVIEKKLDEPTSFEFMDTSLQEAVLFLMDAHHMKIMLDRKALNDEGLDPETPITFGLKNVSLRSALNLMLKDLDLIYDIRDEVLLITTLSAAQDRLHTKVYNVSDLIGNAGKTKKRLRKVIETCVTQESWSNEGGKGTITSITLNDKHLLVVSQTYAAHRQVAALLDQLRDACR